MRMKCPQLPDWCKGLPDRTLLNSNDIVSIFGYSDGRALYGTIAHGCFLPPDITKPRMRSRNSRTHFWYLSTIKAEIKRRTLKQKGEEQK